MDEVCPSFVVERAPWSIPQHGRHEKAWQMRVAGMGLAAIARHFDVTATTASVYIKKALRRRVRWEEVPTMGGYESTTHDLIAARLRRNAQHGGGMTEEQILDWREELEAVRARMLQYYGEDQE